MLVLVSAFLPLKSRIYIPFSFIQSKATATHRSCLNLKPFFGAFLCKQSVFAREYSILLSNLSPVNKQEIILWTCIHFCDAVFISCGQGLLFFLLLFSNIVSMHMLHKLFILLLLYEALQKTKQSVVKSVVQNYISNFNSKGGTKCAINHRIKA